MSSPESMDILVTLVLNRGSNAISAELLHHVVRRLATTTMVLVPGTNANDGSTHFRTIVNCFNTVLGRSLHGF
jgi:hypothetical protein